MLELVGTAIGPNLHAVVAAASRRHAVGAPRRLVAALPRASFWQRRAFTLIAKHAKIDGTRHGVQTGAAFAASLPSKAVVSADNSGLGGHVRTRTCKSGNGQQRRRVEPCEGSQRALQAKHSNPDQAGSTPAAATRAQDRRRARYRRRSGHPPGPAAPAGLCCCCSAAAAAPGSAAAVAPAAACCCSLAPSHPSPASPASSSSLSEPSPGRFMTQVGRK